MLQETGRNKFGVGGAPKGRFNPFGSSSRGDTKNEAKIGVKPTTTNSRPPGEAYYGTTPPPRRQEIPLSAIPKKAEPAAPTRLPIYTGRRAVSEGAKSVARIGDTHRLRREMRKMNATGPLARTRFAKATLNANGQVIPEFTFGKGSVKQRQRAHFAAAKVNEAKMQKIASRYEKKKNRSIFR